MSENDETTDAAGRDLGRMASTALQLAQHAMQQRAQREQQRQQQRQDTAAANRRELSDTSQQALTVEHQRMSARADRAGQDDARTQLAAEREAAAQQWRPARDPHWQPATPTELAAAWATASAWAPGDDEARQAAGAIDTALAQRGIDPVALRESASTRRAGQDAQLVGAVLAAHQAQAAGEAATAAETHRAAGQGTDQQHVSSTAPRLWADGSAAARVAGHAHPAPGQRPAEPVGSRLSSGSRERPQQPQREHDRGR